MKNSFLILVFFLISTLGYSQQEGTLTIVEEDSKKEKKVQKKLDQNIDPLSPARAAFYSAVVPGLGQAYNKKYWKIPIVYAGMGAGIYFYIRNNKQYNRYRDAYKSRLAGLTNDEFSNADGTPILSNESLIDAQQFYSRNKEVSLLVTAAFYILNIIDANVDAHLMQFNVNEDLSIRPDVYQNDFNNRTNLGLSLNYQF
ncbi:DUF5683 domain-containing protein [Pseudofulvibacter geojedonensis]|uniref:DUF5683 domain-containing protein n=1 Tax=Pseudofulvibacter geojedonensis TaxID=1123758 RepID=A0ABW3I2H6_9FLAO